MIIRRRIFTCGTRNNARLWRSNRRLVSEGNLSPRALGLVMEWAAAHREELLEDWNLAPQQQLLKHRAAGVEAC